MSDTLAVKLVEEPDRVERLTRERDAVRETLVETQRHQHRLDVRAEEMSEEFIRLKRDRDRAEAALAETRERLEKEREQLEEAITAIVKVKPERARIIIEKLLRARAALSTRESSAPEATS